MDVSRTAATRPKTFETRSSEMRWPLFSGCGSLCRDFDGLDKVTGNGASIIKPFPDMRSLSFVWREPRVRLSESRLAWAHILTRTLPATAWRGTRHHRRTHLQPAPASRL